jgi:hypothetical protein
MKILKMMKIKFLVIAFSCVIIAANANAQIKTTTSMERTSIALKQNKVLVKSDYKKDSVELKALYESYKLADEEASKKLTLLTEKIKAVAKKKSTQPNDEKGTEMEMIDIQQLLSKRAQILQMVDSMFRAINSSENEVLKNIR